MGDDRVPRSEVCAVQLGRGPAPEEALRGVGKEVRRSHRRRSKICARLQRSWPRVGRPGALRRRDRAISQGRCAMGGDRVPRPEACAVQLGRGPGLEEPLREGGKEVRRSHRRRSELCARLQRSWRRVGGPGALRRRDRAISQGRGAVGVDRVSRPEVCAALLGQGPALEEALRGVGKEVRRSHCRRSEFCGRLQRSWPRVGGPGALRRSDRAISQGCCAVGVDLPTGSLRCSTGPTPCV